MTPVIVRPLKQCFRCFLYSFSQQKPELLHCISIRQTLCYSILYICNSVAVCVLLSLALPFPISTAFHIDVRCMSLLSFTSV